MNVVELFPDDEPYFRDDSNGQRLYTYQVGTHPKKGIFLLSDQIGTVQYGECRPT